jgi:hypothetical protein
MCDPCHAHVLTPGGPEPDQLPVPANRREAPRGYPFLRLGPLAPAAPSPAVHLTRPLRGGALGSADRSAGLPLRLLLSLSAAPGG